jgi:acyl-CoA synthetase (AMP-forming)/AMP-acid ligase II
MRLNLDKLESIPNPRANAASRLFATSKESWQIWPNKISVKLSLLFLSIGGVVVQIGRNSSSGVLSALLGTLIIGLVLVIFERLLKKVNDARQQYLLIASYVSVFLVQYLYASQLAPLVFNLDQPLNPWYSSAKITFAVFLASSFLSFLDKDSSMLKSMSEQSTTSREVLNDKSERNEILEAVNTSTNQGVLQGQISGALLSLNLLTKDLDSNLSGANATGIIENANTLLTKAIREIKKLSV